MRIIRRYWIEITVLLCFGICIVSLWLYVLKFNNSSLSDSSSNWGVFGDYVGGVLGTILSFFSIILIYATYKNQVNSSTTQQFETTFFNLLQTQREILKSISGYVDTRQDNDIFLDEFSESNSGDYLSAVATRLFIEFDGYIPSSSGLPRKNFSENKSEHQEIIHHIYGAVFKGKEAELGHYFRHLYHIVKYVSEGNINNKQKYIDLIQAQMSDDELYVTFYNCISKFGRERFLPLLDKYNFFENIRSRGQIFDLAAKQFYPLTKFKYKTEID